MTVSPGVEFVAWLVTVTIAAWVLNDATRRKLPWPLAFMWAAGMIVIWLIALPLYLFCRPQFVAPANGAQTGKPCRCCGKFVGGDPAYCPHCQCQLKGSAEIHRR